MTILRASDITHKNLKELAHQTGLPMQAVLEKAVTAYKRAVFLEKLNDDFAALHADPTAWQEELEERTLLEQSLGDGLQDA
jgi:hypothetical protein